MEANNSKKKEAPSTSEKQKKGLPEAQISNEAQDEFSDVVDSFAIESEEPLATSSDATVEEEPLEGEITTEEIMAPRPEETDLRIEEDEALWSQIDLGGEDEEELLPPSLRVEEEPEEEPTVSEMPILEPPPDPEELFAETEAMEAETESAYKAPLLPEIQEEDEGSKLCVVARRGVFTGPNTLSIISPNLLPDYDELNHALSSFADLIGEERGFIRVAVRSAPEFKAEARQWVTAIKSGQDPEATQDGGVKGIFGWASYFIQIIWFQMTKSSTLVRGQPPIKPGTAPAKKFTASQLDDEKKQEVNDAVKKAGDPNHFDVSLYVGAIGKADSEDNLTRVVEEACGGYSVYHTPHQEIAFLPANPLDACRGRMTGDKQLVLSASELGELAKVPDGTTTPEGLTVKRSNFKPIIPANPITYADPYNVPPGILPLGVINPYSEDRMFVGMRNIDLNQHFFFCGRTGSGKSELMKWQVFGVAKAGYPIVVIDPHGALCDALLNALVINCPERLKDVVFCDLGDEEYPVALNPLDIRSPSQLEATVGSVKEMLSAQLALGRDSAPRAVNYAEQALIALCEANLVLKDPETKCTLLHMVSFFLDADFRQSIVALSQNQSVRESFDPDNGLFETYSEKQRTEIVQPIVRAFQPLGNSPSFSAVFSAGENRLNFTKLISENKIVLAKLARHQHQAALGEFVGSLILPYLLSSVGEWGRQEDQITGVKTGRGCRVFIDEAPTLLGPNSTAITILAEARKYDLGLIFASQFLDQFDASVVKGALGNTASKLSLVLDPSSARTIAASIAGGLGPHSLIKPDDIAILPNFHWYANLLLPNEDGLTASSGAFSAACLPPIRSKLSPEHLKLRQGVIDRSRVLICNRRAEIVAKQRTLIEDIKAALLVLHNEVLSSDRLPADLQSGSHLGINFGGDPTRIWQR